MMTSFTLKAFDFDLKFLAKAKQRTPETERADAGSGEYEQDSTHNKHKPNPFDKKDSNRLLLFLL